MPSVVERLTRRRNHFFAVAFAIGSFIGLAFFTLIFPTRANLAHVKSHPLRLVSELMQHGATTVFIWLEAVLADHSSSRSVKCELSTVMLIAVVYLGWNETTHVINGVWTYPFQKLIAAWYVEIPAYAGLVALVVAMYYLGRCIVKRRESRYSDDLDHLQLTLNTGGGGSSGIV
eukprot:PLAT15536.3.p1 GENE.PLAT15536.3~~PLAT15536.3.p1  ORF type:complete len:182 (-),score=36.32 PLAT15536.3:138-659(-)